MRYHFAKQSVLGLTIILACCNGCALMKKDEKAKSKDKSWFSSTFFKKEYQSPSTMAAIWSPDILTMTGQPPTRGFGGRVYLYNAKSQAIPVDGELVVHGYYRKERKSEEGIKADKTFRFTAEQLTEHFSPSELGASYSIWIPWDAADGMRQEITLIPSFKDSNGGIVQGAPAKLYLPGRTQDPNDNTEELPAPTQTVSYRKSSTPTNAGVDLPVFDKLRASEAQRRITNINVPRESSIARPKSPLMSPPQTESFTLGAAPSIPTSAAANLAGTQGMNASGLPAQPERELTEVEKRAQRMAESLRKAAEAGGVNPVQSLPASYGDTQLTPSKAIEMRPPGQSVNIRSPFGHAPYSMQQ